MKTDNKNNKARLFQLMGKLDESFKPKAEVLNEWNFDKKKGEKDDDDKEDKKEEKKETSSKKKYNFETDDDKESKKHEDSETPEEEKEEDKKELDEIEDNAGKKVPVNAIAKVGGK
jgi:hypothetical protein